MSRQPAIPKQLFTMRQAIIVVSMIALLFFVFKYGQHALRYRHLQSDLQTMQAHVAEVQAEEDEVNNSFDESLSPAVVEDFAHNELGWVHPDDKVIISLGDVPAEPEAAQDGETDAPAEAPDTPASKPNWRLWLDLLTTDN